MKAIPEYSIAVFDAPSIAVLFRNWRRIRECQKVILHAHDQARYPKLLQRVFGICVRRILGKPLDVCSMHQWEQVDSSRDALDLTHGDEMTNTVFATWASRTSGISPELADRYYRRVSLERAFTRLAAERTAKEAANRNVQVYLSLSQWRYQTPSGNNINPLVAPQIVDRLTTSAMVMCAILARSIRDLSTTGWSFKVRAQDRFQLAVYENGFQHEKMKSYNGIPIVRKTSSTAPFLLEPDNTCIFISDIWRSPHIDLYTKALQSDGYSVFNWESFFLTPKRIMWVITHAFRGIFFGIFTLRNTFQAFDAARFVGLISREMVISDNMPAANVLGFDDYSERPIIRTFVAHQYDAKTIGVQHSANDGTRSEPELCTAYFDHYLTANKFVRAKFSRYWPEEIVHRFGTARLDFLTEKLGEDHNTLPWVLPNPGKPIVLVALPLFISREHFVSNLPNGNGFIDMIRSLIKEFAHALNIMLRPKEMNNLDQIAETFNCPRSQIASDADVVTTEFCNAADLVLCSAGSTLMTECSMLRTKFAVFDLYNSPTDVYDSFGSMLFHGSEAEMKKTLGKLAAGESIDVDYDLVFATFSSDINVNRRKTIRDIVNAG